MPYRWWTESTTEAEESWRQELQAAGPIASTVSTQRKEFSVSFLGSLGPQTQGMVSPTFRVNPPTSININKLVPHRLA